MIPQEWRFLGLKALKIMRLMSMQEYFELSRDSSILVQMFVNRFKFVDMVVTTLELIYDTRLKSE